MKAYTAARLPVHRGPAAWSMLLPQQDAPRVQEGHETADIVIVGGGFAGLSAARRLLQLDPSLRIALLEAGRIAEGASGRNSGFMIDLPHELTSDNYAGRGDDRRIIAMNRQAIAFAGAAVQEYGIDRNYFDPAGKVNGAASGLADAHNRTYCDHLAALNEPAEILDARQMAELTGSRHYLSGLYTPGTVMLQPAGYIRGLAAGLAGQIALYEQSAVTGFRREGAGWRAATRKGTISAGQIILATNGHLESFGIAKGRLMHLFLFASMTAELDLDALIALGGQARWGITPSDPMGTTMRRIDSGQGGNRIITRTCAVMRSGMRTTAADLKRASAVQRAKFGQRFPQLKEMRMAMEWAGHLCLSMNGASVTREVDEGVFAACVQNGLGAARGTLAGMCAAELALDRASGTAAHFAAELAPKRLPPRPVRDWGANAAIRWKEARARDE